MEKNCILTSSEYRYYYVEKCHNASQFMKIV